VKISAPTSTEAPLLFNCFGTVLDPRYDTIWYIYVRSKSWRDGQSNLAHGTDREEEVKPQEYDLWNG